MKTSNVVEAQTDEILCQWQTLQSRQSNIEDTRSVYCCQSLSAI